MLSWSGPKSSRAISHTFYPDISAAPLQCPVHAAGRAHAEAQCSSGCSVGLSHSLWVPWPQRALPAHSLWVPSMWPRGGFTAVVSVHCPVLALRNSNSPDKVNGHRDRIILAAASLPLLPWHEKRLVCDLCMVSKPTAEELYCFQSVGVYEPCRISWAAGLGLSCIFNCENKKQEASDT